MKNLTSRGPRAQSTRTSLFLNSTNREQHSPQNLSHSDAEPPLTRYERARIALASLAIAERKFRLRLVQIEADRRAIVAQLGGMAP